ncbi:MAG: dihydrofolate reductase family protein [Terrimicrobiaceae bacterium]|nr:dihydrofolate reductase family protein [Terrimicrobiaceae bacterium]
MKKVANRPLVTAHFAMTADGKTSTRAFTPALFTSPADKFRLQEVRAGSDAVMAGRGTVATDSMSMGLSRRDLRMGRVARGLPPVPLRVIVSNAGRLDPGWKVFKYSASPLVIFSTRRMPVPLRAEIARKAELFLFRGRTVDLQKSLEILRAEFGVKRLICEGGGTLLKSLASLDLVDEIRLTIAPVIFGGRLAPTLTGRPGEFLTLPREFEIARQSVFNGECFLELRRKKR